MGSRARVGDQGIEAREDMPRGAGHPGPSAATKDRPGAEAPAVMCWTLTTGGGLAKGPQAGAAPAKGPTGTASVVKCHAACERFSPTSAGTRACQARHPDCDVPVCRRGGSTLPGVPWVGADDGGGAARVPRDGHQRLERGESADRHAPPTGGSLLDVAALLSAAERPGDAGRASRARCGGSRTSLHWSRGEQGRHLG